jgi:hypothetical protein
METARKSFVFMFMVKQVNGFLALDVGFERYWFVFVRE